MTFLNLGNLSKQMYRSLYYTYITLVIFKETQNDGQCDKSGLITIPKVFKLNIFFSYNSKVLEL